MGKTLFVHEGRKALHNLLRSSDLSQPQKELSGLGLGARFKLLEQLQDLAHMMACMEHIAPFWHELQSRPGRHA